LIESSTGFFKSTKPILYIEKNTDFRIDITASFTEPVGTLTLYSNADGKVGQIAAFVYNSRFKIALNQETEVVLENPTPLLTNTFYKFSAGISGTKLWTMVNDDNMNTLEITNTNSTMYTMEPKPLIIGSLLDGTRSESEFSGKLAEMMISQGGVRIVKYCFDPKFTAVKNVVNKSVELAWIPIKTT
jgi:hypothetical protein